MLIIKQNSVVWETSMNYHCKLHTFSVVNCLLFRKIPDMTGNLISMLTSFYLFIKKLPSRFLSMYIVKILDLNTGKVAAMFRLSCCVPSVVMCSVFKTTLLYPNFIT